MLDNCWVILYTSFAGHTGQSGAIKSDNENDTAVEKAAKQLQECTTLDKIIITGKK